MKVAIYLCGHGPYREPRLIEVQYLMIMRYYRELQSKSDIRMKIIDTYTDINFNRTDYIEHLTALKELINDIKDGKIETVILDIKIGESFRPYCYYPIIKSLEVAGAKVYNCYYDDEDVMLTKLKRLYGKKVNSYYLPSDVEEFITLFPTLAARISYEVVGDKLEKDSAGNIESFIDNIHRKIDFLREKSPYKGGNLPWLTYETKRKLFKLKEEEQDERRGVEEIFTIEPYGEGLLWDEYLYRVRDKNDFKWVSDRIISLGFNYYIEGNKHSFTMEYENYIIYADPRVSNAIEILIYEKRIKYETEKNFEFYMVGKFKILDNWKNDLKGKLMNRVEDTINRYNERIHG